MTRIAHAVKSFTGSVYWFVTHGHWRIRDVFDDLYAGQPQSETFRNIFREVFGDEYPEEVDGCGFVTTSDLADIARHIDIPQGARLVDLACGCGGAGMWVARAVGAELTGIDISRVAIENAQRRVAEFGLHGRAQFLVGDFADTGLPEESFDGAMSVDSLFLVPDKASALHETHRILRPGARFVFTTWEADAATMVPDYQPLLRRAGFEIDSYEEIAGWRERQRGVHERILAEQDTLTREMGREAVRVWIVCAQTELPRLSKMRRVMAVARKK